MKEKLIFLIFKALSLLPFSVLYLISDFVYFVIYRLVKYRRKVVRQNLIESFPDKKPDEIKAIEKNFYRYLGDQIVETIKLLHISDRQLSKRVIVKNYDEVNKILEEGQNIVLLLGHYCNWEWVQEISRYLLPESFMASIFHPLNHSIWNNLFLKLRNRWRNHIIAMKQAPRTLLDSRNMPWVCGFIADAYTRYKHNNNWIDFLNHKTWFIYGPEEIGRKTGAAFFFLEMNRLKRGHYKIIFHKLVPKDRDMEFPYIREFWNEFEKTIENNPAYWLWSHKRWK